MAGNIRNGVNIFGVVGNFVGWVDSTASAQSLGIPIACPDYRGWHPIVMCGNTMSGIDIGQWGNPNGLTANANYPNNILYNVIQSGVFKWIDVSCNIQASSKQFWAYTCADYIMNNRFDFTTHRHPGKTTWLNKNQLITLSYTYNIAELINYRQGIAIILATQPVDGEWGYFNFSWVTNWSFVFRK